MVRWCILRFRKEIADGVDIVLDYLWGPSAEAFLAAATGHGSGEAARRIRFVNIGSLGGASIPVNASALRSSGLEMMGSGLGSVSHVGLVQSIGKLMQVINAIGLRVDAVAVPLTQVESAWVAGTSTARTVFTM